MVDSGSWQTIYLYYSYVEGFLICSVNVTLSVGLECHLRQQQQQREKEQKVCIVNKEVQRNRYACLARARTREGGKCFNDDNDVALLVVEELIRTISACLACENTQSSG